MVNGDESRRRTRRNATVAVGTAAAVAAMLSYRTSLDPHAGAATLAAGTGATAAASGASATLADGTWTGESIDTRWGAVQVEITVAGGRITAADAIASPDGDGRSIAINQAAVPQLDAQAVAAQASSLDGVSGATYTSDGYRQSLQSAIDQAAAAAGGSATTAAATTAAGATAAGATAAEAATAAQAAEADAATTAATATTAAATTSSSRSSGSASGTYAGDVVETRFGPVQVQVVVQDGKVVSADATSSPDGDPRSSEINAYAVPILDDQAVAAQSASIDGVSGATYTSRAYAQSLQSALDQAGIGTEAAA